ncbi:hypothetical protein L210DRAFT_3151472 [Boletus edulis BED1]|uniref:DNA-directed DNA polymerase X domain-containing protein n=1 Tax=Boletus edulis BED1 TaxID=1328754 RepID=A0AAD4BXN1_BOLED|nr:hypothetical protein L210DRAFT_3151472 [Boletus edulis BED1]
MLTGISDMEEEKTSASSNSYKVRAYSKAITAIGQLPEQVRFVEQVSHLEGIGVRIAKRINAYLSGIPYEPPMPSRPKKAKNPDHSLTPHAKPKTRKTLEELLRAQVVASLSSISGIGSSKANALYDAGCRSLQDLREPKFFEMLSRPQQINARYMIGLDHSMTREQASTVCDFVTQNISSKYTVLLSGDFRRGTASAQHITLIVLHPQNSGIFPPEGSPSIDSTIKQRSKYDFIPSPFANHPETRVKSKGLPDTAIFSTEIISSLECRGLLATCITAGTQKWDGIIRAPERTENGVEGNGWETRAKRIQGVRNCDGQFFSAEIYYVPHQCAGAASIALTGDMQFNLAVRKAASQLGFRLNEYGLWKWRGTAATASVDDCDKQRSIEQHSGYWELVASEMEEEILEAVGMGWVAPERRNFANLDVRSRKRKTEEEPTPEQMILH